MALHLGSRRFHPSLFATLLALFGIALTCRLGFWQLDRAEEKRVLAAQFDAGEAKTQVIGMSGSIDLPRYQLVAAQGRYDAAHQVLIDNMPSASGRAGFRVLTPFALSNERWILVDRGWVPMGPTRNDLPDLSVSEDERTITGRLDDLPRPGMRLAKQVRSSDSWPQVLNFPEHAELEALLKRPLDSRIVLLDASVADGYERTRFQRPGFGPERHIGYAVQWFALAATMLVIYLLLGFKTKQRHDDSDPA